MIASPIYDYISILVERSITGKTNNDISLWKSILIVPEEIKKLVFILLISLFLMILPGINMISPFVTAFLLVGIFLIILWLVGGSAFKERKSLAFKSKWRILGLGLWLF